MHNGFQVATGVRYTPQAETYSTLFSRIRYAVGFRYGQAHIKPNGEPLNDFGMSFGMDIPIRGSLSAMNLAFEYGQRGDTGDHMIQENFYRINIGVNIYERWFSRRRFF